MKKEIRHNDAIDADLELEDRENKKALQKITNCFHDVHVFTPHHLHLHRMLYCTNERAASKRIPMQRNRRQKKTAAMLAFVQWFYHGRLGCSLVLSIALHIWNIRNTLYKYKYIAICRIIMDDNEWERKKTVLNNFVFLWRRDACHFLHIHGTYYICIYLNYELF